MLRKRLTFVPLRTKGVKDIYLRTHMQTHTPTVVEWGRSGWNLSLEFSPRYNIHGKFLSSIDTLFCRIQDDANIMG